MCPVLAQVLGQHGKGDVEVHSFSCPAGGDLSGFKKLPACAVLQGNNSSPMFVFSNMMNFTISS